MSKLPTLAEQKALQTLEAKLRLMEDNKKKARESLLMIQLLLAKRPLSK